MMTCEELKQIIETKISFKELKKNEGIVEFHEIDDVSFGVSYESDDEGKDCYIYNLFVDADEYVNIGEKGNFEQPINDLIINELVEAYTKINKQ